MTSSTIVKKERLTGAAGHAARRAYLERELATHRVVRERFEGGIDLRSIDRAVSLFELPEWAEGSVGLIDAMFLYDMVACVRPRRVIEIGVASGVSSAVLLHALADAGMPKRSERGPALVGFDLHAWCYFDRTRRVGAAVAEMAPGLMEGYELHTGATAHDARVMLEREGFEMAFIDGDHRHPAPTIDLLALLPVMRPGAWVVLHDIDLPAAAARYEQVHSVKVPWHHAGAQYLYEGWPFDKFRGEGAGFNIGAVRVPRDRTVTITDLESVLALAPEVEVDERGAALLNALRQAPA